nr:hypothetical protein [Rhodovulum sulfidophilum]
MAGPLETPEPLDVATDEFAGPVALVAPHGLGWIKVCQPADRDPGQPARDRRARQAQLAGDGRAGQPQSPAQLGDQSKAALRQAGAHPVRSAGAVLQRRRSALAEPSPPFASPDGYTKGLRHLGSALNGGYAGDDLF